MVKPGLFYLEALETPPESRRKGYDYLSDEECERDYSLEYNYSVD